MISVGRPIDPRAPITALLVVNWFIVQTPNHMTIWRVWTLHCMLSTERGREREGKKWQASRFRQIFPLSPAREFYDWNGAIPRGTLYACLALYEVFWAVYVYKRTWRVHVLKSWGLVTRITSESPSHTKLGLCSPVDRPGLRKNQITTCSCQARGALYSHCILYTSPHGSGLPPGKPHPESTWLIIHY